MSPKARLQEMFQEMVMRKNAVLIPHYYHPDFILETNGERQDFAAFIHGHQHVYATDIAYEIRYDEAAWVEEQNRVAAHIWVTTRKPGAAPAVTEIVLIASFLDGKIHRVWETTYPDWRQARSSKED